MNHFNGIYFGPGLSFDLLQIISFTGHTFLGPYNVLYSNGIEISHPWNTGKKHTSMTWHAQMLQHSLLVKPKMMFKI